MPMPPRFPPPPGFPPPPSSFHHSQLFPPPGAPPTAPYVPHRPASHAHAAYLASSSQLSPAPLPFTPSHFSANKRSLSPTALQPAATRAACDADRFCSDYALSASAATAAVAASPSATASAAHSAPSTPLAAAPAATRPAAAAAGIIATLASSSPGAIVPFTSDLAALPPLAAAPADTSIACLLGSALPSYLDLPLPAAASSATTSDAFAPPAQTGLHAAAPPDSVRVLPTRPPPPLADIKSRTKAFSSIPRSQVGMPHHPHPIISTARDADSVHANGVPNRGYKATFDTFGGALGHILHHYATHEPPPGLCMNCFLFHDGTACASPAYDWSNLLAATHPACPQCRRPHHPPCRLAALPELH